MPQRLSMTWPGKPPWLTQRNSLWPAFACVRYSSETPTIRKRDGFWDSCPTGVVGQRRSPSTSSRKCTTSTTRRSAGCPPTGNAHLDAGELPAPLGKGDRKTRWLPVAEADRLRADWKPPWKFSTEHFEIQTNVTLADAISFGRRLEDFHDLFMTLLADILGENLPLTRRFKDPKLTGDGRAATKLHQVYYFASKAQFVDHLSPTLGPEVALNLGFYDPPKSGRGRVPAYFYRDPNGQIPEIATLYHEVSHQLLFETAGPNSYTKNTGNFWVFEGLGLYFETVTLQPDGSLLVGVGLVGPAYCGGVQFAGRS